MKIYNYNAETKEYLSTEEAQKSPLEKNVYLTPANATTIATIGVKEDEVAIFDGEKWVVEKDYRNQKVYSIETQQEQKVDYIGDIKDGYTLLEPFENCKWDGKKWVGDIDKLLQIKINTAYTVRDKFMYGNISYLGLLFKADRQAQQKVTSMALFSTLKGLQDTDIVAQWNAVDGNIDITFEQLKQLGLLIEIQEQKARQICVDLLPLIKAMSYEELETVDIQQLFESAYEQL
jgi:hypothetical protein